MVYVKKGTKPTGRPKKYACVTCPRCGETDLARFYPSQMQRGRSAVYCKDCLGAANRGWRKKNPAKAGALLHNARDTRRWWTQQYKQEKGCLACGEKHPACLEFHHRNPNSKLFNITHAVQTGVRMERLLAEVAKCDVLCANCHRKLHHSHIGQPVPGRKMHISNNTHEHIGPDLRRTTEVN